MSCGRGIACSWDVSICFCALCNSRRSSTSVRLRTCATNCCLSMVLVNCGRGLREGVVLVIQQKETQMDYRILLFCAGVILLFYRRVLLYFFIGYTLDVMDRDAPLHVSRLA